MRKVLMYLCATLLACGLSNKTYADSRLTVSTFAAPENFLLYLREHDERGGKFDDSSKWVNPSDANVIVIFVEDLNDIRFVPALLYSPLVKVFSIVDTHFYELSSKTFGDSFSSDVYVFSVQRLKLKMEASESPSRLVENVDYLSCFSAGLLNSFYEIRSLDADYSKIGYFCEELLARNAQ